MNFNIGSQTANTIINIGDKMAKIKIKCGKCKHEVWLDEHKNTSCPKCGTVIKT
jgi:Zn finger protein HypA/HybF involved in hydrogenase expression